MSVEERAREIASFFGMDEAAALAKLSEGFLPLHSAVTADFRACAPGDEAALLAWYAATEAYIWELSAYHEDAGFNYAGQCRGIAEGLAAHLASGASVYCLGDGIGDLTLTLRRAGFDAWYHDLAQSRTAAFARFRYHLQAGGNMPEHSTTDFRPPARDAQFEAVVSLDFLEHVPNVEAWVGSIYKALKPGGFFIAQNAFACGSGENGPMPMHLAVNDRFEKDWDPLLTAIGFEQLSSNWYQKRKS